MTKTWSSARVAKIRKMVRDGTSIEEIARIMRARPDTISGLVQAQVQPGEPSPPRRFSWEITA